MKATPRTDALLSATIMPDGARPRRRMQSVRIVVGVDGSRGSGAALRWAAAEASRRDAALRIVSAWQGDDPGTTWQAGIPDPSAAAAGRVQDALDGLVREHGCPQRISCVTPGGLPGRVLVEQAAGAELLVLGADPGAGPGRTGSYCVSFARCPVVFVVFVPA